MKRIYNIIKAKLGFNYDPYLIASKEQKALWYLQGLLIKGMKENGHSLDSTQMGMFIEAQYLYNHMQEYF